MAWLDIHILQTVPPSNINRDDAGSPKTAYYGGTRRARVSSQAWKRAVRTAFRDDPATSSEAGRRTRRLPQVIADRLQQRSPTLAEQADTIGILAASATFKVKAAKSKEGSRPTTEYLLFLGEAQADRIVSALLAVEHQLANAEGDKDRLGEIIGGLGLGKLGVTGHPGAVACSAGWLPTPQRPTWTPPARLPMPSPPTKSSTSSTTSPPSMMRPKTPKRKARA